MSPGFVPIWTALRRFMRRPKALLDHRLPISVIPGLANVVPLEYCDDSGCHSGLAGWSNQLLPGIGRSLVCSSSRGRKDPRFRWSLNRDPAAETRQTTGQEGPPICDHSLAEDIPPSPPREPKPSIPYERGGIE